MAAADDTDDDHVTNESEEGEEEESTVVYEFDGGDTRITDYEWTEDTLTLTVEADQRTTVALTDSSALGSLSSGESTGDIPYQEYSVDGEETIEFDVQEPSGAGDGQIVTVVADGDMWVTVNQAFGFIDGSASWNEVQAAAIGGIGAGAGIPLLVTALIAWAGQFSHQRVF
ncbi:hypothetical protein AArcMg_1801 [Natrarchaeobaculum sulfurireducens]|uniref:Uncharacterized protein n=1 Tax=Natrarchaeobaculum sulfurireducens TaxID=2044521 RepID=A0A346PQL4_9EURY|nr:hypothetical protein AArcMg_1801 [Natrarchaeobaculum sulfurireducens]